MENGRGIALADFVWITTFRAASGEANMQTHMTTPKLPTIVVPEKNARPKQVKITSDAPCICCSTDPGSVGDFVGA
eukprot:CAMPEP_0194243696 /NCGR_PEP_ID=MMETSP0158-20130606/9641_1 /TAXON_ID=33649 /ORGANISM="Thalassionema nitzschioides, Strain L26-B" /LENGTH=75 /DNA_ID=CAMNT_0038978999 /DNA_START=204 /DNA_END=431 /DNA_ORIENTATION=-